MRYVRWGNPAYIYIDLQKNGFEESGGLSHHIVYVTVSRKSGRPRMTASTEMPGDSTDVNATEGAEPYGTAFLILLAYQRDGVTPRYSLQLLIERVGVPLEFAELFELFRGLPGNEQTPVEFLLGTGQQNAQEPSRSERPIPENFSVCFSGGCAGGNEARSGHKDRIRS